MIGTVAAALIGLLALVEGQAPTAQFIVTSASGPRPASSLRELRDDFSVRPGPPSPQTVAGDDLLALRRVGSTLPGDPVPPFVVLTGGERLPLGRPLAVRLEEEQLHFELAAPLRSGADRRLTLPQAAIDAIWLAYPAGVSESERGAQLRPDKPVRSRDAVVFRNGDRLEGTLKRLTSEQGVRLAHGNETTDVPLERIAFIVFNPDLQAGSRLRKRHARIVLSSGTRLRCTALALDDGQLQSRLAFGGDVSFPLAELVSLQVRLGSAVYLDELTPIEYRGTPFLDLAWPLAVQRNLRGGPLRLGSDVYDSGLTMHSRSRVSYALDGKYQTFEAQVGVDPLAGPQSAVKIGLEIDGRLLPGVDATCKAGESPLALRVEVREGKRLTLITDFGPRGDVQGHAVWADARLVKAK